MRLKRLMGYLLENIDEAMQLEPPSGYIIEISEGSSMMQRDIFIKMIKNNPPEGKLGRVKGYIKIERGITVPDGLVWELANVEAESGYGPLLYDLAMEMVYILGDAGLMPDRTLVSPKARAVWQKYYDRGDIGKGPLPKDLFKTERMSERPEYMRYYYYKANTDHMSRLNKLGLIKSQDFDLEDI
jgi:hypothetical protein